MVYAKFLPERQALSPPFAKPTIPFDLVGTPNNKKMVLLPDFKPTAYSVICGRGKECFNSVGNRRFRIIASMFLKRYMAASSKLEKSLIVTEIVDIIREASPEGAFVKFVDECWWEVEDDAAREKVGAYLRDCLHVQYRSSTKAKLAKRKAKRVIDTRHDASLIGMTVLF